MTKSNYGESATIEDMTKIDIANGKLERSQQLVRKVYCEKIQEKQKEITKLKELLGECKQLFIIERSFMVKCTRLDDLENIITKIQSAIGESEER